ncbi:type II restriction endonuclease [Oceaniradius stylonematis]|uniref:type II restriction endonuclease n=1 Tax=Oceaniradius stylonematis TaxID=2184161 RepID=UPI003C7CD4AA
MIRYGLLSDHFEGVAAKQLSAVETSPDTSNQHEFNGTAALRRIFGDADRRGIPTRFMWLGGEQAGITSESTISWYDARRRHETRTEYRLYYPANEVTALMEAGDMFFLALRRDGTAVVIITPAESTLHNQLRWLFGLDREPELQFTVREIRDGQDAELDFTARFILDELGIELEEPEAVLLDRLLEQFDGAFPSTREFSAVARGSLPEIEPGVDDPDAVLMAWLEREEALFRRLERHLVSDRLRDGFMRQGAADVDGFLAFSLSVQNRRKARAGQSLENHLQEIFAARGIRFDRGAVTEGGHKPDFLFPGITEYHDRTFPTAHLTMLGAKSSLKDRWRQVLTEAERIPAKHLLTLEPAISEKQTAQMQAAHLQLVLPKSIHASYLPTQQDWLLTLTGFIEQVTEHQAASTTR